MNQAHGGHVSLCQARSAGEVSKGSGVFDSHLSFAIQDTRPICDQLVLGAAVRVLGIGFTMNQCWRRWWRPDAEMSRISCTKRDTAPSFCSMTSMSTAAMSTSENKGS